jgi:hypothetical protein
MGQILFQIIAGFSCMKESFIQRKVIGKMGYQADILQKNVKNCKNTGQCISRILFFIK